MLGCPEEEGQRHAARAVRRGLGSATHGEGRGLAVGWSPPQPPPNVTSGTAARPNKGHGAGTGRGPGGKMRVQGTRSRLGSEECATHTASARPPRCQEPSLCSGPRRSLQVSRGQRPPCRPTSPAPTSRGAREGASSGDPGCSPSSREVLWPCRVTWSRD